eukprot:gene23974-9549_t
MQMPASNGGVKLAHTSAVEQGLAGADTFATCRHSFLTWMVGTPIAQLRKQGTDLEQLNGIDRRLLRDTDNAAFCLDLVKTLGFSWFSGERATPTSKGDADPPSIREVLVGSAPPQPTTSLVTTAHVPATSPTTTAQGLPQSASEGQGVGGSVGLEIRQEATPDVSRGQGPAVHWRDCEAAGADYQNERAEKRTEVNSHMKLLHLASLSKVYWQQEAKARPSSGEVVKMLVLIIKMRERKNAQRLTAT